MNKNYGLKQCPIFGECGDFCETSPFGERVHPITKEKSMHTGVDGVRIDEHGTHRPCTIVSIADGIVVGFDDTIAGYSEKSPCGNYVRIRHSSGRESLYLHLEYNSMHYLELGMFIRKGEPIGVMGATGRADGVHIHFQVYDMDMCIIDPTPFLTGEKNINDIGGEVMYIEIEPCSVGDSGENVKNLQKKLCQMSKDLEIEVMGHSVDKATGDFDGVYGKGVGSTICSLQWLFGLPQTGAVDERLCELLNNPVKAIKVYALLNNVADSL